MEKLTVLLVAALLCLASVRVQGAGSGADNSANPASVASVITKAVAMEECDNKGNVVAVCESTPGQPYECLRLEGGQAVLRDKNGNIFKLAAGAVSNVPRPAPVLAAPLLTRVAATSASIGAAPLVLPAPDHTFNVRVYGAKGDGKTDDVDAIQAAIDAAANAGPGNTVYLPAAHYCLSTPGVDRAFYFRIPSNAVDLTITGDPADTILLSAAGCSPFLADRCTDCTIKDLTVDFGTLNVTQGTITAEVPGGDGVTVHLDPGYAPPDADVFTAKGNYEPPFYVLSAGRNTFDWMQQTTITSVTAAGDDWMISLGRPLKPDGVGKRFFIWGNQQGAWKPFVDIRECKSLTVENITDYAGGGFSGGGREGIIRLTNFYSGPPPGSNRLGFYGGHQGHSRADVIMTHCQFLMSNDDDMNELSSLRDITAQPEPNTIEVASGDDYETGDTVSIWDYSDINAAHVRENAVIQSVSRLSSGDWQLVLDKDVEVGSVGRRERGPNNLDVHDRVVDLTSGGKFTLIDCSFSASFAHPLLLKTARGLDIEGCRIYGSDMSGLDCGMQTYWNEGPQTCNVTLKHNVFYDIDGVSCRIGLEVPHGASSASHDQQNIDIEDNVFLSGGNHAVWNGIMPRGVALLIGNVHQAIVKGNVFAGFPNANLVVYSSDHVAIDNNVFLNAHQAHNESNNWKASANIDPGSLISISDSSAVSLDGNLLYDDGPYATGLVAVATDATDISGADTGVSQADPHVYPATGAALHDARLIPATAAEGAGYVVMDQPDSHATFTVTVPKAGRYPVVVTYNNAGTDSSGYGVAASQQIVANGNTASPATVRYLYTGNWGGYKPAYVTMAWVELQAGSNTLQFNHLENGVDLRDITVPVKS